MRALRLPAPRRPLELRDVPLPAAGPEQVVIDVLACAVCRTDLHIIDGELQPPRLPLVPGHQVVGRVSALGVGVDQPRPGERVGVPWLGWTDGTCVFCASGRENLCPQARFTGFDLDGGYAERIAADARFCLPLPDGPEPATIAPLLCAGAIGYRAMRFTGDARRLGLYGFGNAARIVTQVGVHQGRQMFAFTRPSDAETQRLALEHGCVWAGDSTKPPPEALDAAILFAAAGELVPLALEAVAPGGTVVCAEIHMSDIPSFPYERLWRERVVRSVANLTRSDGVELLELAAEIPLRTDVRPFAFDAADEALAAARSGDPATPVLIP